MINKAVVENSEVLRRHMAIKIDPDLILDMLKIPDGTTNVNGEEIFFSAEPIPDDAKVVRCGITDVGEVFLVVEHESFSPLSRDIRIPYMDLRYGVRKPTEKNQENVP
jgi:hypothetical protein